MSLADKVGLADGFWDAGSYFGSPMWETIREAEGDKEWDRAWLAREGFLSETPTPHDTWMEANGFLDN